MHLSLLYAVVPTLLASLVGAAPAPSPQDQGNDLNGGTKGKALLTCVQKALGSSGANRIVTPQSPQYASARAGVILVEQYPALVVYPNKPSELSPLVKCASSNGFKIAPRTGAHHFENWSALTGSLVIDMSNINYVMPSENLKTVVVGGGAKLGALYSILGEYGVTFTGGICPSVGIGGYIGIGGYNMQMRTNGLAVDHMVSAKVILANGNLVTVSPTQNKELWFAMRGGGTYGLTTEVTLKTTVLPRSAMFAMDFGADTRLEVTKKFLKWAARQDPLFNSQLNLYGNRTNVLGWYIGKTENDLAKIVEASGLNEVRGGTIRISGNCSPANSRNFWLYTQNTCTDDLTAEGIFHSFFNVAPDALAPVPNVPPVTALSTIPALPDVPSATKWSRVNIKVKTYVETKAKPLSDDAIKWLVDESAKLPHELDFWAEITTFNITAPATTSAFPWQAQARTLFRLQVMNGLEDAALQKTSETFASKAESYLRTRLGEASYAGYIDTDISVNPLKAYYGNNVCRLIKARKQYDPTNVFSNPFSVPPTVPKGITC
ncbi:Glucooligosaccharide oxidase [Sporormia fimetaria CBS 119925]|uniref:Glucooligosaccharide oxidase n=1 Tax=Sporormia fimetaria CBS 119925 TaxID=1340428 RepID=A0A6A6UW84_9PLEO|nr:Glucooligosaccharide oxidase [Sporormia fimetaria CBS 119925]